jgi:magnesium-transporting ATPase (P-type)
MIIQGRHHGQRSTQMAKITVIEDIGQLSILFIWPIFERKSTFNFDRKQMNTVLIIKRGFGSSNALIDSNCC